MVVVATLRTEKRRELAGGSGELSKPIREVLDAGAGLDELTPIFEDPTEKASSAREYPDADRTVGLGEALAHSPQLLRIYRDNRDAASLAHLAVQAVIDWRRCGIAHHMPEQLLSKAVERLAADAMPARNLTRTDIDEAIGHAAQTLPGRSDASQIPAVWLHPSETGLPGDHRVRAYRPNDYLLTYDAPRPLLATAWHVALAHVQEHLRDAFSVGYAAYQRGNVSYAEKAWLLSGDAGNAAAMFSLGVLLDERGAAGDADARAEAEKWWRRASEAGHTAAMLNLGVLLDDRGDEQGAEKWWRRASEAGHTAAMLNLGVLLDRRGDERGAEGVVAAGERGRAHRRDVQPRGPAGWAR
jgi:TPR repeat protein